MINVADRNIILMYFVEVVYVKLIICFEKYHTNLLNIFDTLAL